MSAVGLPDVRRTLPKPGYEPTGDFEFPVIAGDPEQNGRHERTITVTRCGCLCLGPQKIDLSHAFAGQKVGIKEVADKIWLVSFMGYDLGFFDHETFRIEGAENPFVAKVSPMSPE